MRAFVTSRFSLCLLAWMLHSRNMEHQISNIHEKALKLVYNDTPH